MLSQAIGASSVSHRSHRLPGRWTCLLCVRILLCLSFVTLGFCLPCRAQGQRAAPFYVVDSSAWDQMFSACFDPQHRPLPGKLSNFIAQAEAQINWATTYGLTPDPLLGSLLASAYAERGDYNKAERLWQQNLGRIRALYPPQTASEWTDWTERKFLGLHALQGKKVGREYLKIQWRTFLYTCLPVMLLPLGWLLLWWPGARLLSRQPFAARDGRRLALLCCIPLLQLLYDIVIEPCSSYLVSGNAWTVFVLNHAGYMAGLIRGAGLAVVYLFGGYLLLRVGRLLRKSSETANTVEEQNTSEPAVVPAISSRMRLGIYAAAVLLGILLDWSPRITASGSFLIHLPAVLSGLAHHHAMNFYWVWDLLMISVLGSFWQEYFFRRILYAYARQVGGIGFGLVFSALVFAAIHLSVNNFYMLFWAGILYAGLYEISRSLVPSTVVHSLHNLLWYISQPV